MAIHEQDRESLIDEAKAYRSSILLRTLDGARELLIGVRENGATSCYWTSSIVLQFNSKGELRRGFLNGRKFAAQNRVLLERIRVPSETRIRFDMKPASEEDLSAIAGYWNQIRKWALHFQPNEVVSFKPDSLEPVSWGRERILSLPSEIVLASAPNVS